MRILDSGFPARLEGAVDQPGEPSEEREPGQAQRADGKHDQSLRTPPAEPDELGAPLAVRTLRIFRWRHSRFSPSHVDQIGSLVGPLKP